MKVNRQAHAVSTMVFTPTILSYSLICAGEALGGLAIYAIFGILSYKVGIFDELKKWPSVSQVALALSPLLIGIGLYLSAIGTSYFMLIPAAIYTVLSMLAGIALI